MMTLPAVVARPLNLQARAGADFRGPRLTPISERGLRVFFVVRIAAPSEDVIELTVFEFSMVAVFLLLEADDTEWLSDAADRFEPDDAACKETFPSMMVRG